MIEIHGLTKRFEDFTAVDEVTLSISSGEILALLGPNGAGKTTTVRMLAAILNPTAGSAQVAGYDVVDRPREVRRRVGVLTEQPGLYLRMRGREYLDFYGRLMGLGAEVRENRAGELLAHLGMVEAWDRRLGTYSKGMRQKMALARAMLHDPPVLLLDEPTSAMDPHSAKLVRDAVLSLRHERRTIVLCTHNLPEAETLADRIAIIRRGQIIALGTPAELKTRLLGPPLMELRTTQAADPSGRNGAVDLISDLVTVESHGEGWLRYGAGDPEETNPAVVRRLAEHGVGIVTLSEVSRSMDDVYLRAVVDE